MCQGSWNIRINWFINGFRRILNGLYDPLYEGTGLPIDPHLRQFVPDSVGSTNVKS